MAWMAPEPEPESGIGCCCNDCAPGELVERESKGRDSAEALEQVRSDRIKGMG